jgi:hypothetical protein
MRAKTVANALQRQRAKCKPKKMIVSLISAPAIGAALRIVAEPSEA